MPRRHVTLPRPAALAAAVLLAAMAAASLTAGAPAAAAGAGEWVLSRYRVEADGPVPRARYTLIQGAPAAPPSPLRALVTDAAGRRLVVDARTDPGSGGGPPLRRAAFRLVGAKPTLQLRFRDPEVEIVGPNGVLAAYRHGEENRTELRPAFEQVRSVAGPELLAALATYVRVGLAREPAFRVDAVLFADALFPEIRELVLQPERREKLDAIEGFDPARHPPLADEEGFGQAYGPPL